MLYLAARHPDNPWYAKLLLIVVVAYVFSPVVLIPDLIPVLGYLNDLLLLPFGIAIALRLPPVLAQYRGKARKTLCGEVPGCRGAALQGH